MKLEIVGDIKVRLDPEKYYLVDTSNIQHEIARFESYVKELLEEELSMQFNVKEVTVTGKVNTNVQ